MIASVVDLRYKMKDVLKALKRRERVEILYHGKPIGQIVPLGSSKSDRKKDLSKLPFFGMHRDLGATQKDVDKIMDDLRGGRYRDL